MSNKKFDLIEEFSKPIERDSSHNKVNTLSFLASTLIIVLAIGVYAFTIVMPSVNQNQQNARTINSPVVNESNNLAPHYNQDGTYSEIILIPECMYYIQNNIPVEEVNNPNCVETWLP